MKTDEIEETETENKDRCFIACNYSEATSACAQGALCYVSLVAPDIGAASRVLIVARSRGGRWIQKWEKISRLENFRIKSIPPLHPRFDDYRIRSFGVDDLLPVLQQSYARSRAR